MTYIHTVSPSCREIFVLQVWTSQNNTNVLGSGYMGYVQASGNPAEIKSQFSISSTFFFPTLDAFQESYLGLLITSQCWRWTALTCQCRNLGHWLCKWHEWNKHLHLHTQHISTWIKQFIRWSVFWNRACKLTQLQGCPCQFEFSLIKTQTSHTEQRATE